MDVLYIVFGTMLMSRWNEAIQKNYGGDIDSIPSFEFWSFLIGSLAHFGIIISIVLYTIVDLGLAFMGK